MRRTIYFDYNATTPLDATVRDAMLPFLGEIWGNPSSVHHVGRKARSLLDDTRDRGASFLGAKPSEVIFTSGGTESNNLAIFGAARALKAKGKHLITSQIEHHAVLHCFDYLEEHEGFAVTRLPVDREGRVSPDDLTKAIRPDTTFASIMAAVVVHLPPSAASRSTQASVEAVFGNTPRIVVASITAFLCGTFVNSYVLAKMKIFTRGRWLWTRIVGSTLCGELVDSLIFYFVAFYGRMPQSHLIAVMFTQYALKSGWEILAAPVTYRVVAFLKRAENEDYYDRDTNFTPFSLKA